jgi:outer membrane protein assembly factor BamB
MLQLSAEGLQKMLRKKFSLLFVLVLLITVGCVSEEKSEPVSDLQTPVFEKLVSKELLDVGDLELVWQSIVPLKKGEIIRRLVVSGNRLYALTSKNFLVSLNRENGKPVFSRNIGQAGFPVFGLNHYENELYSVVGNKLAQINNQTGETISEKGFDFGVVCSAARNNNFFYIGSSDKRVHTLKADNKVEVFKVAAESDSPITTILADEKFVIFGTEAGDVICITPERPVKLWSFRAAGAIIEPFVKDADNLYFASKDTSIYCINLKDGSLKWKYASGTVPAEAPVITSGFLYQNAGQKGLFALNKSDGAVVWQTEDAAGLLAESAGRAYLITKSSAILVMDNKNPEQLYSLNMSGITNFASNTADSKIYIADNTGRVACVKPIERKTIFGK